MVLPHINQRACKEGLSLVPSAVLKSGNSLPQAGSITRSIGIYIEISVVMVLSCHMSDVQAEQHICERSINDVRRTLYLAIFPHLRGSAADKQGMDASTAI